MGISPRKIPVNFWCINPDTANKYSEELIGKAFQSLDCSNLGDIPKGATHSLDAYAVENSEKYISGALVYIQHADLPVTYKRTNKSFAQVPLMPDQGLCKVNCFVYEKRRRLLLIESSGEGSSTARDWCTYFRGKILKSQGGQMPTIHPAIIQQLDAQEIFNKFTRITQFNVHLARLRDVSMFRDEAQHHSSTSGLFIGDGSGSDEVICSFRVPSRRPKNRTTDLADKPSLHFKFVTEWMNKILEGLERQEIKKLEIVGQEDDLERMTPLNLLANRVSDIIHAVPFTDSQLPSQVAVKHRCELIQALFEKHALVLKSVGGD